MEGGDNEARSGNLQAGFSCRFRTSYFWGEECGGCRVRGIGKECPSPSIRQPPASGSCWETIREQLAKQKQGFTRSRARPPKQYVRIGLQLRSKTLKSLGTAGQEVLVTSCSFSGNSGARHIAGTHLVPLSGLCLERAQGQASHSYSDLKSY